MNEVKKPRKPLIFYYCIVLICLILFNSIAVPWLMERQVKEVDYGTFISMTEKKQVDRVDLDSQENVIYFTFKTLPQTADMNIKRMGIFIIIHPPDIIQKLLPCKNLPRIG